MKNLKKLKAVLATELEAREVYQEAFDIVKDAEKLEKYVKEMSGEAKVIAKDVEKAKARVKKAEDLAEAAEAKHTQLVQELDDRLNQDRIDAGKEIEAMYSAAEEDVKALQSKKSGLVKTIKDLERRSELAKSDTDKAEKKLEEIRAKLKSI